MVSMLKRGLLGLALVLVPLVGEAYPTIERPVVDEAHVLAGGDVEDLASRVVSHRTATTNQIAVLLVNSTNGEPIEDFAHGTFEQWRGGLAGRDNGILVVLAVRDHRSRIEVGRGLEPQVTDGEARVLLDNARGHLRASNYAGALRGIVNGLITETGGTLPVPAPRPTENGTRPIRVAPQPQQSSGDDGGLIIFVILTGLVAVGVVVFILRRKDNDDDNMTRRFNDMYPPVPSYGRTRPSVLRGTSSPSGFKPTPAPASYVAPVPSPSPVPAAPSVSPIAAGLAGAAVGAVAGAAANELLNQRREPTRRYDLDPNPMGSSRFDDPPRRYSPAPSYEPPPEPKPVYVAPVYSPPPKKEKKRDSGGYSSSRDDSSSSSSWSSSSSYDSGSSSSSYDSGSSSSSYDSGSSSSSYDGGGGSSDGGGSSSDW